MDTHEKLYYGSQLLALLGAMYLYESYFDYFMIGVPLANASLFASLLSYGAAHALEK